MTANAELDMVIGLLKARPLSDDQTLEEMRAGLELIAQVFPLPPDVVIEPAGAGGVRAEWVLAPRVDSKRVVLYLHGGGYMIGSLNTHREIAARIGRAAGARVLTIDYRLAPEHRHPAAVEDALTAYRWLLGAAVDPRRLAIAGDSAGGGLTVAMLVAARAAGLPMPAAAVCLSPWVDLEGTGDSYRTKETVDPVLQRRHLKQFADAYLGPLDPRTPLASPIYAELRGLPPMLIQVGTAEILLDDATRLAERARQAGVEVTFEAWEDMIHVWQIFAPMLAEGRRAIERIGEFVRKKTA